LPVKLAETDTPGGADPPSTVTFSGLPSTFSDVDFHQLYARYAGDVHRFALYLSGNRALAEDITSETFLRAWSSGAPIREATVKAYLFTIARNVYLLEVRRTSRITGLDESLPSGATAEDERLAQRSALDRVLRALRALPEIDRAALLMRTHHEMSYEEIAHTLCLSLSAAKVKVHRARLKLAAAVPGRALP
jgi:RNA polymerase sigma-70 factor (ECF subfamily)